MIRAVLDCNVVVAAMLDPAGQPARPVGQVREAFDRDPHRFVEDLAGAALMVTADLPQVDAVPADPSDDVYLATALAGAAPWLVTGDRRHLLQLGRFAGVCIVTPAAFLAELASRQGLDR